MSILSDYHKTVFSVLFRKWKTVSLSVSRAVSQVIIRVHKPTVAYKLVQPCSKNPKGALWLIYYKNNKSKFPCTVCRFNVHNNHQAIFCDSCHNWTHLGCSPFTRLEYSAMSKSSDDWYCSACLASIFPFNHFDNDIDFFFALYDFNFQGDFGTEYALLTYGNMPV